MVTKNIKPVKKPVLYFVKIISKNGRVSDDDIFSVRLRVSSHTVTGLTVTVGNEIRNRTEKNS